MKREVVSVCVIVAVLVGGCAAPEGSPSVTPSAHPGRQIAEGPLLFGDTITYVSDAAGNYEVFVLSPDSQLARLTESEEDESSPVWSPDGTMIAFSRQEADGTIDVWIMDADGGSQHRIYDSGSIFLEGIAWHPNGRSIYLSRGYFDGPGNMGLKVIAISVEGPETQSGLGVERLWDPHFTYAYPSVTVDGAKVAFAHYERYALPFRLDIYTGDLAADGMSVHRIVRLTEEEGGDLSPAWSRDGTALAWAHETARNSENYDIWVMNADGSEGRPVTSEPGQEVDPVWSSDGRAVIYASDEGGSFQLYMRSAWGDEEVLQLTNGGGNKLNPHVKPSP